jgi:hypothetical protein
MLEFWGYSSRVNVTGWGRDRTDRLGRRRRNGLSGSRSAMLMVAAGVWLVAGCDEPGITDPADPVDIRPYVTGAAAANLGPDGLFLYPAPLAPAIEPIISAERARELALSFALSFGPALERYWKQEHGRSFDFTRLEAEPRVFYQRTPYELFPDGFHGAFRRIFGPFYLVRLSSGGQPRMSVAVSAYNTNVAIFPDGRLNRPMESGGDFFANGFPADPTRRDVVAPLTPEEAVAHVASLTGVRVTEVPEAVRMVWNWGPLGGGWKLTLEQPITVRTLSGSRTVEVRELYLGREGGRLIFIPAAEQPVALETGGLLSGESEEFVQVRLPILHGQPTVFEEVSVVSTRPL